MYKLNAGYISDTAVFSNSQTERQEKNMILRHQVS